MLIPEYMKLHIKKLYIVYSNELSKISNFTNLKEERLKQFKKILKVYYPWASKNELRIMTELITDNDTKLEEKIWANNINQQYKQDIIELFGVIDKDNSCSIDISECKEIF